MENDCSELTIFKNCAKIKNKVRKDTDGNVLKRSVIGDEIDYETANM